MRKLGLILVGVVLSVGVAVGDDLSKLDVPLTLTEPAGVDRTADIVSTGVPLPAGLLAEPAGIAVFDPSGRPVPAQFAVLERWREFGQPPSVKWLLVTFLADVPKGATAVYRLKAGANPAPAKPAAPVDGLGPFKLMLTNADGKALTDADVKDVKREVVEAGPVRACVRLESPTSHETFSFIAWVYSYAGLDRVDATVVLKNTPTELAGPFYFRDFAVSVAPEAVKGATDFLLGAEPGKAVVGKLAAGEPVYLLQDGDGTDRWDKLGSPDYYSAVIMDWSPDKALARAGLGGFRGWRAMSGERQLGEGNCALGWSGLIGGERSAVLARRHFRETYPTAAEVAPGMLTARLLPSTTKAHGGLHWLDDSQRKRWDLSLRLINGKLSAADGDAVALAFDTPLVAHCGIDWYRQTGIFGKMVGVALAKPAAQTYPFNYGCQLGWVVFGGDTSDRIRRRYHEYPMTAFITSGDVWRAYRTMIGAYHSSGMTPLWLDDYQHPRDTKKLTVAQYCSTARAVGKYREGTAHHGYKTWNTAHFCCQELYDAWRLFGDPLAADAIADVTTYLQSYVDYRLAGGSSVAGTRSDGHPLSNLAEAYRITADPKVLQSLRQLATTVAFKQVDKARGNYGTMPSWEGGNDLCEKPFMMRQVMDGLREYWELTHDEQVRDQIIGMLDFVLAEAMLEDDEGVYGFTYVVKIADAKAHADYRAGCLTSAKKEPGTAPGQLSPGHVIFAFEQTGNPRYRQVLDKLLPAIYRAHGSNRQRYAWLAQWLEETKSRPDATPPAPVADLAAEALGGGKVKLTWTTPADAARLEVKFADKPIVENLAWPAQKGSHANWWAASHVPGEPAAQAGKQSMTVEGVPAGARHFAIRAFDAASNRSPISNGVLVTVK